MKQEDRENLVKLAISARDTAYAPYSGYTVGAALLGASGKVYTGGNIENASFGATNCAERTAFFKAVSEGERKFVAIAISGGPVQQVPEDYAWPCGICRQVMKEFCGDDFLVCVVKSPQDYKMLTLEELLPHGFGGDILLQM